MEGNIVEKIDGKLHCRSLTLFLTETPTSQLQRLDLAAMSERLRHTSFSVREKGKETIFLMNIRGSGPVISQIEGSEDAITIRRRKDRRHLNLTRPAQSI